MQTAGDGLLIDAARARDTMSWKPRTAGGLQPRLRCKRARLVLGVASEARGVAHARSGA